MMRLPIESRLIYEIYPETLADWFSHQPIEEQALFLSNFLSQLDENRMAELSKEIFAQYRYCGKRYEGVEIIYTCYKKMRKVNPDDSCFKYIKQDFGFYGKQW